MSFYTNRTIVCLLNMIREMRKKGIENSRIIKTASLLLESGLSATCIPEDILLCSLECQWEDGGYIGNSDTLFNALFLGRFPECKNNALRAISWIRSNEHENGGWGRTGRDIARIPVTGLLMHFCPNISTTKSLRWLEDTWAREPNSLTYKAAYVLSAFAINNYVPTRSQIIEETAEWLISQQEDNGGFGPWKNHPAGPDIVCTSIAALGLLAYDNKNMTISKTWEYMKRTQLQSGIWPFHEIEDGASWGLYAMTKIEEFLDSF